MVASRGSPGRSVPLSGEGVVFAAAGEKAEAGEAAEAREATDGDLADGEAALETEGSAAEGTASEASAVERCAAEDPKTGWAEEDAGELAAREPSVGGPAVEELDSGGTAA